MCYIHFISILKQFQTSTTETFLCVAQTIMLFPIIVLLHAARFRTVLPSISQVNKTLEGSEVLLIQNHNQVVVSGDGKIAAGLSETRKKLDSLNKLTLELDRKVQALEQKVTQMTDSGKICMFNFLLAQRHSQTDSTQYFYE